MYLKRLVFILKIYNNNTQLILLNKKYEQSYFFFHFYVKFFFTEQSSRNILSILWIYKLQTNCQHAGHITNRYGTILKNLR